MKEIQELESQLTGDLIKDMELRDRIHNLKMIQKGIKPVSSEVNCVGCGS